tara:strand:+ start:1466 stop:1702 length:237 start_codon:yes stop_codon:yes gene_type:complete
MSKKKKEEKPKIEKQDPQVLIQSLLQMIQYMANALNLEAAGVLHNTGWCKDLIADDGCPVCKIEKERENDELVESKDN